MAWSFTKAEGKRNRGVSETNFLNWWNSWSVTELAPTSPDTIRLRVSLSTSGWYKVGAYVWYCTDELKFGTETVTARSRYEVVDGYGYTVEVEVPARWNGQRITLEIGWCSESVKLEATLATPSTITASDGVFGGDIPVSLTPSVQGVRHTLTVSCAGEGETLIDSDSPATSAVWTPALAVYAPLLPNAGSTSAVFTCETFYNGVSMGSTTKTVTVSFDSAAAPTVANGWAVAAPYNTGSAQGFTVWIQGKSRAEVSFDTSKISCAYGATVAGYAIRCEGETVSASPYRTGVLAGLTADIVCTVTDSRGLSASETLRVTLLPYSAPQASGVSVIRCDALGDENESGGYIAVTATAAYSPLDGENSATLRAAVRTYPSGQFGSETMIASGQKTVLSATYSPDVSFEVRVTVTDGLGTVSTVTRTLFTRKWAMKFREDANGVAFGKAAEQNAALELANGWTLVLHGPNGETASLSYAQLTALLALIQ